jgi:two-component system, NarL family, invasion response regulator UvrY
MKFLVIDDHSITRLGIENLLKSRYPFCKVDAASNGLDAVRLVKSNQYEVVILDVNIPGTDTLELAHKITVVLKHKVLVLSMNPKIAFMNSYLNKGAAAFLEKSVSDDVIANTISDIISGKIISNPIETEVHSLPAPFNSLTKKEFSVLLLLIQGKSVGEIATLLDSHTSTIGTQKQKVFDKTGVDNIIALKELYDLYKIALMHPSVNKK